MQQNISEFLKKAWPDAVAVVLFLLIGFLYFQTPIAEGLVLSGHDNDASLGLNQDVLNYAESTGETSRWTNSVFSGMPTYQIAPSYESSQALSAVEKVYTLGTTGVLCYVFVYLLGFYILMRTLRCRPWLSAVGALVWAFSSYFFIIIAAGHIWKVLTLGFIPPTIAGLVLCYRGRLLWGGAVTALFTALQILSNHIQMSYYFGFVMLCVIAAYGIASLWRGRAKAASEAAGADKEKLPLPRATVLPRISGKAWLRGTAVFVLGGIIGILANLPNLYHTYSYTKESMRGKAELTPLPAKDGAQAEKSSGSGLDYDYITAWSYGVDETLTLLIPDFKGGGSGESMLAMSAVEDNDRAQEVLGGVNQAFGVSPEEVTPVTSSYWGRQPMTVGPVYVGAIVCFLFFLGIFIVRTPLKWGLLAATVVSLLFAWGSEIPPVTHFLIDHLPLYNKFRTVSSALVMLEFTMPLLAMLALAEVVRRRDLFQKRTARIGFIIAFLLTAGTCLVFCLAPGLAGDCLTSNDTAFIKSTIEPYAPQLGITVDEYRAALTSARHDILSASALRSCLLVLVGAGLVLAYTRVRFARGWMLCVALGVLCLGDMWAENKRYLNDANFSEPDYRTQAVEKTPADQMILADKDPHYRVVDVNNMGNNSASYYHKTVGGYHAAKLRRYNDLMERKLMQEAGMYGYYINTVADMLRQSNTDPASPEGRAMTEQIIAADSTVTFPILNMLNAKYVIVGRGAYALQNPAANGNAWFVDKLTFVKGADAEMAGLDSLDTKHAAVADESFRPQLDGSPLGAGTAKLTAYAPNRMTYSVESDKGGLLVFSEVYYPGWEVTIDGKPAELGRVNYVLRALKVPAGKHEVVMTFAPASVTRTNIVAYVALLLILLGLTAAVVLDLRRAGSRSGQS